MPIVDEISMQQMFQCFQQTRAQVHVLELYVDFDVAVEVQDDPELNTERQTVLEVNHSDSEDEFEANYEISDEYADDEEGRAVVAVQTASNPPTNQHPFGVLPFMLAELPKYANMIVVDPDDGEFMFGMEYNSRKSVISAINNYTISKGVDYTVHESEPLTFYAKCKSYGSGCDWIIQTSLI
ncbi:hypothetical protein PIB30_042888 [Stylosanthes scabra]|uniref:Transposase MuDR plant domain-containing protein n=1 Tax=Stylosanthes scabra TaxID=79078 RepID=A0ABU6RFR1_9FABA|nr:hypothetical protein [Stylosanthes scabra]